MRDTAEWRLGRFGEKQVRRLLVSQGHMVMTPADWAAGEAPVAISEDDRLGLPDLLFFRAGEGMWAEVKAKSSAWMRSDGPWHGTPARQLTEHWALARRTGLHHTLWIVERDSGTILRGDTTALLAIYGANPRKHQGQMVRDGVVGQAMANWPRSAFEAVGHCS